MNPPLNRRRALLVAGNLLLGRSLAALANPGATAHHAGMPAMLPYYMGPGPVMMPSFPEWIAFVPSQVRTVEMDVLGSLPPDLQFPPRRTALKGHDAVVTCLAFAPDGLTLASGSADRRIILWDTATWHSKARLVCHTGRVAALAHAPDGLTLATGGDDGAVVLWDLKRERPRLTLKDQGGKVTAVAFAPDGAALATGGMDGKIKLRDADTGKVQTTIDGSRWGPVWELVFAADGTQLAGGFFQTGVVLWDAAKGRIKDTRRAWHNSNNCCAASLLGQTLLAVSRGPSGAIWCQDLGAGNQRPLLTGHKGAVRSLALQPGASLLASGGVDKTVRIWSVREEMDRWMQIERLIAEERERRRERAAERERKRREEKEDK